MGRPVHEVRIQDKSARARLKPRSKPYWRMLSAGCHLGYYRGACKGSWIARRLTAKGSGTYETAFIGEADDTRPANGHDILDWRQAFALAIAWLDRPNPEPETAAANPDLTISDAVCAYIDRRDLRRQAQAGRAVRSDASYKLTAHVLCDRGLAALRLSDLTEAHLRAWQLKLARKNPKSLQRVVNELKAALNAAWATHRRALPADLPVVIRYGLQLETPAVLTARARDCQILPDAQVRAIVTAALTIDADFGRLVLLLAATGARFAQLRRMTVGDVQPAARRVMIPQSFKGHKHAVQHIRVQLGDDTLGALAPIIEGRPASAPLLERWRHRQTGPAQWERHERGAWTTASEMTRLWKDTLNAAGLPSSIIPYALRHSSIVRGLRLNLPIRLVAAIHDTSVAMIERHYARWITEGLDELAARAVVPLIDTAA